MAVPDCPDSLVVFDFDETLANESSDDAVARAAPGGKLPDWLTSQYRDGQYNEQMQRVMAYLAQQGVPESSIRQQVAHIPETPGLTPLLNYLRSLGNRVDCVVMSDANSYFIEAWLSHHKARPLFSQIFTNPSHWDEASRGLVIANHHAHSCARGCPDNMCKQKVIRDFLERRSQQGKGQYRRVFYVGDGANDVCPCLALGQSDVAFARRDFPMHRILTQETHTLIHTHKERGGEEKMRDGEIERERGGEGMVTVHPWSSGEDIVKFMKTIMEEK
ncbi:probable phosphatase phospho1 [Engraulis encrasicolus]|uniref:probable phosphatase phospho1 n=1 Tax=Engraulis encrasicolus TaxID=184585 RepID=UPI002FD5997B